jgi:hypothetical protein
VAGAPPPDAGPRRGLYVLGAFSAFVPVVPTDFTGTGVGLSGGVRVGYRPAPVVGVEALFEYAHAGASGQGKPAFEKSTSEVYAMSYALSSVRVGLNARLMTTGERFRFVQLVGGGVALDTISWAPGSTGPTLARRGASGADGFLLIETGFEVDIGGVLLGLALQNYLGSRGALDETTHDQWSANTYGGPLYTLGLGLRAGYRLW